MAGVVVVTDSTSSLTPEVADEAGVVVVPLQVIVDGTSRPEAFRSGPTALTPGQVAAALREGRAVSTSRPSPEAFSAAYAEAMSRGADAIVSIHLSGSISGTVDAAVVAGRSTSVPVTTVDSRTVASACGFAVLAAARAAAAGGGAAAVAEVARRLAARSVIYFCVENVEFLRRGGRIGTAQALLGSALAVKPLLTVAEGQIRAYERVRTMTKAMARLEDLAVTALGAAAGMGSGVDVAVLHLDNRSEADRLAASLIGRVPGTSSVTVTELSAVLGVHTGPGTVGVVVARRD